MRENKEIGLFPYHFLLELVGSRREMRGKGG